MEKIIGFRITVDGVTTSIGSFNELKREVRSTNAEFGKASRGTAEYDRLAKRLGTLKAAQSQVRREQKFFQNEAIATGRVSAGAYQRMSAQAIILRNRLKDLAVEGKDTTEEFANLNDEFQRIDRTLKNIDSSFGQNQRRVGSYAEAIESALDGTGKLSTNLGTVVKANLISGAIEAGLNLIVNGFNHAIDSVVEFEQALAELSSITGLEGEALENLGQQAVSIASRFGTAITDIVDGFSLAGSARPELLQNADALAAVTEQADLLANAAGLDLPTSIEALTKIMNQFGIANEDASMAVDILATSQQLGTARIAQLSESFKNAGSALNATNLSLETGNALLQGLAKGGLVGAEAGTALRSILLKLSKTGREDLNPAITDINEILNTLATEVTDVNAAQALFGEEAAAAALTLIAQRDVVTDLNGQLNQTGNAYAQARTNTDTFEGSINKLSAAYEGLIVSVEDGDSILSRFIKNTITGATNLLEVLSNLAQGQGFIRSFALAFANDAQRLGIAIDDLEAKIGQTADPIERARLESERFATQAKQLSIILTETEKGSAEYADTVDLITRSQERSAFFTSQYNALLEEQADKLFTAGEGIDDIAEKLGISAVEVQKLIGIYEEVGVSQAGAADQTRVTLDSLQESQKGLRSQIEQSIIDGKPYTDLLKEWRQVTQRINDVNKVFKEDQKDIFETGTLAALQQQLKSLNQDLQEAPPDDYVELLQQIVQVEQEIGERSDEIKRLKEELTNFGSAEASINQLSAVVAELKKQLNEVDTDDEAAVKALVDELADAERKLADARKAIADASESDLTKEIRSIERRNAEVLKGLQEELTAKTITNDDFLAAKEINEINTEIKILRARIQSAETSVDEKFKLEQELAAKELELVETTEKQKEDARKRAFAAIEAAEQRVATNAIRIKREELKAKEIEEEEFARAVEQINLEKDVSILQQKLMNKQLEVDERLRLEAELVEKEIELEQKKEEAKQAIRDKVFETIDTQAERLGQINSALGQFFDAQTNRQTAAIRERYAEEIRLAEGNKEKIEELEKQRDEEIEKIEKARFEDKKKIDVTATLIDGARAAIKAFADLGPIGGAIAAAIIAFETAAKVSFIKSQSFKGARGVKIDPDKVQFANDKITKHMMRDGGRMNWRPIELGAFQGGRYHSTGGNHSMHGGRLYEIERDEFADLDEFGRINVINRRSSKQFRGVLQSVAGKQFAGKGELLSMVNSYSNFGTRLGKGGIIGQDGVVINAPAFTPDSVAPSTTIVVAPRVSFDDESLDQFQDAVAAGSKDGTMQGTVAAQNEVNRTAEREENLNNTINGL